MITRWTNAYSLNRALDFLARLWRARGRAYRPERHYLRGKSSGLAAPRRPGA